MGTNFYQLKQRHVGKRTNVGDEDMKFLWAIYPHSLDNEALYADEYGNIFNYEAFLHEIENCKNDMNHIGEEFS